VVEPGIALDDLNRQLRRTGLMFGPRPATHESCTLGGMIGNTSCGATAQAYGKTVDNVRRLEVLTYDGLRMWVGPTTDDEYAAIVAAGGRRGEIYRGLRELRDRHLAEIRRATGTSPAGCPATTSTRCCPSAASTWRGHWSAVREPSYTQFMPEFGQARAVQIDVDPTMIGMRYPFEVNLVGDAAETLDRLLPLLQRKDDSSWRETVESNVARRWEVMGRRATVSADPINPEHVFAELSPRLPTDAIISSDSGSAANWYARHIKMRGSMRGSLSGTLATMGPGVPYVIGAKFGRPDRPCYALVGDGAMQMNGINELITIAKYWRDWTDPRLVVAVLHNNDLNQVTWELRAMGGSPQFLPSQHLPDFPYAGYARSLGLAGITAEKPDEVGPAWDEALAADRPCAVEFLTDPAVPPIPPHATWDQILNAAESIVRGDADRVDVIKEGVKRKLQEFLPGGPDR